jgi:hypothetical protein
MNNAMNRMNLEAANNTYISMRQLLIGEPYLIKKYKYCVTVNGKALMVYLHHVSGTFKCFLPSRFNEDTFTEAEVKEYNSSDDPWTVTVTEFNTNSPTLLFRSAELIN